ncbi:Hypothetical protein DEACI_2691 [Acididesulfobacillus acetoxydans]|uniref:HTH ArsR-type DNA-binding domain n=1 Tax=Acididesulfobacillus acetoxydans TaxID=1561005 RepID=A0A8S0X5X5_9FIRM|nr:Hypothetical protein DEACI_2691 [Acididesulfobacillus acetoxydans]CEJ08137.1 HTH ArsR-type DNA-binding domain [Acididesulfobacillus acetoxydans]
MFLNPDRGWKMVYGLSAMMSESVDLYDTTDGGKNWTKISVAGPTHTSATGSASLPAGTLPYGGIKNGLSFVNTSTGWITGYVPAVNYPWIFVTHDGGHTWVHQELPVPKNIAHYASMTFDLTPPAFFTSKDGILVERIADVPRGIAHPAYVFFFTQDGGRTWVDQPSSALELSFPASDPKRSGQSFSVTVNGITWHTVDHGYTWTK